MTATEAQAWLALPHAREAVRLRRADDAAKIAGLNVPALEAYRPLVAGSLALTRVSICKCHAGSVSIRY